MKNVIFGLLLVLILIIFIYFSMYLFVIKTEEPLWLSFLNHFINDQNIDLEIKLDRKSISTNDSVKLIATLTNKSENNIYFGKSWFSPERIGINMYDSDKKGFRCDYSPNNYRSVSVTDKDFFLLKPNEKKEFHQTFVLKKGFIMMGKFFPWVGSYLYDGSGTYVFIQKGQKTIFFRVYYFLSNKESLFGEQNGLKVFKDKILSNEVKLKID